MPYDSHAKTWITTAGSTITVFTFPSEDGGEVRVGVAINNEYERDSIFKPFSPKQSEKVMQAMLECKATSEQVQEAADFLHKELRRGEIKKETETTLGVDSKKGISAKFKKKTKTSTSSS